MGNHWKGKGERILLWVSCSCRYQWSKSGKQQYLCELLLLQKANEDIKAARNCVIRVCLSSWWDWKDGSRPFFGDDRNDVRRRYVMVDLT